MVITSNAVEKSSAIAAFDFDGTITDRDTFLPFLRLCFGSRRLVVACILALFESVRLGDELFRDRFKRRLIASLFARQSLGDIKEKANIHAKALVHWIRPAAIKRIEWHRNRGHRLVLVSASLEIYLEPIYRQLGFDDLLCTRLQAARGKYTGEMIGANCRGREKVSRLTEIFGPLDSFEMYAYGDSAGDKEMLEAATHAHFRKF